MPSNSTIPFDFNPSRCTLETCSLGYAYIHYDPSLAGNALYAAIFGILLIVHLILGIRYRTWSFSLALFGGLILEIIGYGARIQMHFNPWLANPFLTYLICLTIAPCFLSAGIYLCLSHVIAVYGEHLARFKPRTYMVIFICCDILSLVFQAIGGALADTAHTGSLLQLGINIMIGGLALQVASLTLFISLCADFASGVRKKLGTERTIHLDCSSFTFHAFLYGLALATLCIYIRSCFRVAELRGGFRSELANNQIMFMVLKGAMIVIASIAMTVVHPGLVFGASGRLPRSNPRENTSLATLSWEGDTS